MIRVISLYHSSSQGDIKTDITSFCKSISLSSSKDQPVRKCEGTIVYPIFDANQPRTQIGPSNIIWIIDDVEGVIFQGIVFDRELNSNQELTFTAYDFMIYLVKSKASFNFQNITPEDSAKKICSEVNINTGTIVATGIKINRLIQQKSLYEAVMESYSQASKENYKQYIPIMEGDKFSVIEKGKVLSNYTLSIKENVINASYKDTMDNMINRVKIYDGEGNYIGKVEDSSLFKNFGILQETYQAEEDKNYNKVASNMLHGIDTTIDIEVLGNLKCRTGYAVKTEIWYVSVLADSTLYIDADTHTWDMGTGKYTMQLTLNLSNNMDSKEVD
ncbi:terminase [Clostridium sp. DJ247]|uniref:XkdQ/YqbQ family protein n=1 Tax=Clostridium sp. DJ247 TaxID=2726188 RepID=UPI00162AC221|nr:terminase [Clostridium sp. DJ247]MBC2579689.1 terminase [Clostridium sp. DJ247]